MAESPLYERIGGSKTLQAAVGLFYQRVMEDELVAPFFAHLDMYNQVKKQISLLTMALGGSREYTGRDMRTVHAPMVKKGLSDRHFDAVKKHLLAALRETGVEADLVAEVETVVESMRSDVLCR